MINDSFLTNVWNLTFCLSQDALSHVRDDYAYCNPNTMVMRNKDLKYEKRIRIVIDMTIALELQ